MSNSFRSTKFNVRVKHVFSIILWSTLCSVASQSHAEQTDTTTAPLDCSELIHQIETKLFQTPNNELLIRAFQRAISLCQPTESTREKNNSPPPPKSNTNAILEFGFGYHSNPTFVADYEQIDLNFNGVSLRLTNPEKTKPTSTQRLGMILTHKRDAFSSKRQDEYQFNLSLQRFDSTATPNRLSSGLRYGAFFQQKAINVSYQHTQEGQGRLNDGNNAYGFLQLEGLWAQNNGALNRLRLGRTFYTNAPVLEGSLIDIQHFFPKIALSDDTKLQPMIGIGGNIEVKERAGGNQLLWQAALGATTTWVQNELHYGIRLGLTQDVKEYSEILEKNSKRDLLNLNSYLKWRYLGLDALTPNLTLSYVKQQSNIELFNWQFWQIELSMQIKW